ncbi:TetR/AcrR family transcriptional regulator [Schumannella sp. 10F1B-5-1]|uniref:TetR/AcrR family transcriptional regulator n=1 Tax=Schumannella sp. 10F1B-5-1 TaxID=2590780 RepID=UPI0015E861CF|nr:TetR/AcrR family transcriptional regulator [Schumannella sp. 10F1B-5-1]
MDARQRRSRAALRAAVLQLAAETPIAEVTATDIAAAAGVHRTTFYQHAASPVELLLDALGAEIDEARQRTLGDHPESSAADAIDAVSRAVLEHIDHHAAVYRRGLGPASGGGSLHRMLGDHFLTSIRLLREQGRVGDAPVPAGADHDYIQASSDRHHADGAAGAIAVWLDLPEPRSIDTFLQVLDVIQPPWWPRA